MKIRRGDPVPTFVMTDTSGEKIDSRDLRGRRWLISFYRYAGCPLCNLRIHTLSEQAPRWQETGFRLLAVFESDRESIQKRVGREQRPFPLIPDPGRDVYRQFGVESSWLKFIRGAIPVLQGMAKGFLPGKMEGDIAIVPADFLIDEQGIIAVAYYGRHIGDHLPLETIERFINGKELI
ncbi:MAG: peroxiredoxin-like family protein [Fidelibacterota bacterium]